MMTGGTPFDPGTPRGAELQGLRDSWGLILLVGVCLVALGLFAISASFIAGLMVVELLAILLIIGGVFQLSSAFWTRKWDGFFVHLIVGVLNLVVGLLMVENPLAALTFLTLLLAVALVAGGLLRLFIALTERFHGWGWVALSGGISLVLGVMIWRQWPESSVFIIGMFVGIELVFSGLTWVMLGLALKSAPPVARP